MAETLSATTRRRLRTTAGTPKVHRRDRSARLLLQAKGLRQRETVSVRTDRWATDIRDRRPCTWWPENQEYCKHGIIALVVPACTRDCDSSCSGPRRHLTIQVGQVAHHDRSYRLAGPRRLDASGARRTN